MGAAPALALLATLTPVTRAAEIGVIAGQTWTRNEIVGALFRPAGDVDVVGTGRCFTIAIPYTHPIGGPWSWSVIPTHYHLEYHGPAVSSAEIPVMLRWTARSTWSPYVEVGGGVHLGAGLRPGDERRGQLTPCLDAGVGLVRRDGSFRRLTLAVHTVSAPQHGEWARRVSVLAGVTQTVVMHGGEPPRGTAREGALVDTRTERFLRLALAGGYDRTQADYPVYGSQLSLDGDSIAAGSVVDAPSTETGPLLSTAIALVGDDGLSLSVQPTLVTRRTRHTYSIDGVAYARDDLREVVLRVPVQVRWAPLEWRSGPYLAIGPTFSRSLSRERPRYVVTNPHAIPGPGGAGDPPVHLLDDVLNPTIGASIRVKGRAVSAEIRSAASYLTEERNALSVVVGVDLTTAPRAPHTPTREGP